MLQEKEVTGYTLERPRRGGVIEYVDTEEEETTMIAMTIENLFEARVRMGGSEVQTVHALRDPPEHDPRHLRLHHPVPGP